jgi:hypothetical protein
MNRAEQYRERAEECVAFSTSIADPTWRAQLLSVAAAWHKLADWEFEIARRAQQATRDGDRIERTKSWPQFAPEDDQAKTQGASAAQSHGQSRHIDIVRHDGFVRGQSG